MRCMPTVLIENVIPDAIDAGRIAPSMCTRGHYKHMLSHDKQPYNLNDFSMKH